MTSALDLLSDFIEEPGRAAAEVRERPSVAPGVLGYIVAAVSLSLARRLAGQAGLGGALLFTLSAACLLRLCLGFVHAGIVHLVAEALGGRGRALPLFSLMGLSELGWALALPGVLLIQAAGGRSAWLIAGLFGILYLLCLFLKARGIRDNYGLGAGKAWLALLAPYVAAAVAVTAMLTAAVAAFVQYVFRALA